MNQAINNDYFWIYIVVAIIFFAVAVYFMPKIIRFFDKTADRRANGERNKGKDAAENGRKGRRYKTF